MTTERERDTEGMSTVVVGTWSLEFVPNPGFRFEPEAEPMLCASYVGSTSTSSASVG